MWPVGTLRILDSTPPEEKILQNKWAVSLRAPGARQVCVSGLAAYQMVLINKSYILSSIIRGSENLSLSTVILDPPYESLEQIFEKTQFEKDFLRFQFLNFLQMHRK